MLDLPPTDPHNWYRNAIVHTLDCPHGNWWFLPWHRAYLGYFERTCRKLSGDPDFALPYWDWTKMPFIPTAMFQDVLDPNNDAYIGTFKEFDSLFDKPVSEMWAGFTPAQSEHLARRGYRCVADFWDARSESAGVPTMFFERGSARGPALTAAKPDLDDDTKSTVLTPMIRIALREPILAGGENAAEREGFGSSKTRNHQTAGRQGILETGPHNHVHGGLGRIPEEQERQGEQPKGFMTNFLSPVDPIFFLHHANLDRLWDVWTRRQLKRARPTLPEGADLAAWSSEQFLFFIDEKGDAVMRTNAGDYAAMAVFDYDYEPGSHEDQVELPAVVAAAPSARVASQPFSASISRQAIRAGEPAGGVAHVPGDLLRPSGPEAPPQIVEVTLQLTPADQHRRFQVLVSLPGGNPINAGTIAPFGPHAAMGPATFTLPLPENLGAPVATNVPLDIRVVALEEPSDAPARAREAPLAPGETPTKGLPRVTAIQVRTN
jgi:hypothetical protein